MEARSNILDGIEIGTGTWQWGDTIWWDYNAAHGESDARQAFEASLAAGVHFFDTAEIYGQGKSERLLGAFCAVERERDNPRRVIVATKFAPLPYRIFKGQLLNTLKRSLDRLRMSSVDLYQIHWNSPPSTIETWMNGLADALDQKLIGAAGVSNYNRIATIRAHAALQKRGYGLATNQVEYHLLNRSIERDGTFEACRERGIKVIAYSPLAQGLLTGKYSSENPPPGMRRMRYRNAIQRIDPIIALLKEIGERHSKTPAQVALNWVICKGAIPIPGAKNASQVGQNAGAVGWRLSDDEVGMLEERTGKI